MKQHKTICCIAVGTLCMVLGVGLVAAQEKKDAQPDPGAGAPAQPDPGTAPAKSDGDGADPAADPVADPAADPVADPVADPAADPVAAPEPADPPAEPAVEPAAAVSAAPRSSGDAGKKVHIGVHVGVVLPQLQSELGTAPGFELEGGFRVWNNLSPYVGVGYSQPAVDGELSDPRLGNNDYMTTTTQRELTVTLGAMWRFLPVDKKFNAYAGLGARIWMLETLTNGDAGGAEFLENRETSTRYGAAVMVGGEFTVGPGAATAELDVGGSDLPHLITGDVATTAISTTLGYRLMF